MTDLTFESVALLLQYNPETGKLFWKPRPVDMFKSERDAKIWNTRYSGKEAFTCDDGHGYRQGNIHNRKYQAHRVIWLLHTGAWPAEQIDHVSGDRADNRIENLRPVSHAENGKNKRKPSSNTSGVVGVFWHKVHRKWLAKIMVNGRHKHLGLFGCFNDAVAARKAAEREMGFHPNHGKACA